MIEEQLKYRTKLRNEYQKRKKEQSQGLKRSYQKLKRNPDEFESTNYFQKTINRETKK